ncbi:MAG: Gfo/Idh/MocA family oxidoreductase [Planctomycetota bacterium]|jgi:predicted dehydrogenase
MRIDFRGNLVDEPEIRAGFIGAGSHSFRNLYPTFQFARVKLEAVCDLDLGKAWAFAAEFGAKGAYADHHEMLEAEELDAVFICVGYDEKGRPIYPDLAVSCLEAGVHVWIEKPPAAFVKDIERMQDAARRAGRKVLVGMKKMFFPANRKAKELAESPDFGSVQLVLMQYPQRVPPPEDLADYVKGDFQRESIQWVRGFVDHLCHPVSLMVYLLGAPRTLYYERSPKGAGNATFTFEGGAVASIALTHGSSRNAGMERTTIVGDSHQHVTVENNIRVTLHRNPACETGYGETPDFYTGGPGETSAVWEPEFSLGQLYSKGLFLLGYYDEVNEFARAILDDRDVRCGTLEQAAQVTRVLEGFYEGPGKKIKLT